jgi:hypothetical protein
MLHLGWPRNLQSLVLWFCELHRPQRSASWMRLAREGFGAQAWWTVSCFSSCPLHRNRHTFSSLSTLISSWDVAFVFGSAVSPFWTLMYSRVKLSQDGGKEEIIVILNWTLGILKLLSLTKLRRSQYFLRVVRCSLMSSPSSAVVCQRFRIMATAVSWLLSS